MTDNMQIFLAQTPRGKLEESHFDIRAGEMPAIGDGEVLVRSVLLSIDAANRAWMQGATYKSAVEQGQIMHGYAIGEVVESNSPAFAPGDVVGGELGWQEHVAMKASHLAPVGHHRPLTHHHSVLGIAGITAYHGLLTLFGVEPDETLLVSAAAGSVGSLVGQIGRIKGARVVGVAGGPEKCAWVVGELGFDACIDYKNERLSKALRDHCPDGVDIYFDNVGGEILDAALLHLAMHARVVLCGAISQYNVTDDANRYGVKNYMTLVINRGTAQGFIILDYMGRAVEGLLCLHKWVQEGKIVQQIDMQQGFENIPATLARLFTGANIGKQLLKVSDAPLPIRTSPIEKAALQALTAYYGWRQSRP